MEYLERIKKIEENNPDLFVNLTEKSSAYIKNSALYNTNNLSENEYLKSKRDLENLFRERNIEVDLDKFATELITFLYDNRSR